MWHGSTRPGDLGRYLSHLRRNVVPELRALAGFRGTQVMHRVAGDLIEVTVTTIWESREAISRFAGADEEAAVVAPEAQGLLVSYERRAIHYDIDDV